MDHFNLEKAAWKVRQELEFVSRQVDGWDSYDLCGACFTAAIALWELRGRRGSIGYNDFHGFYLEGSYIVDVTATQFPQYRTCAVVVKEIGKLQEYPWIHYDVALNYDEILECLGIRNQVCNPYLAEYKGQTVYSYLKNKLQW